jgi:hypothetical protein
MPELTPEALAKFEKAVTDEAFMEQLLSFALRRKRAHYWRGVWDGHLPGGKEVSDVVQEAVEDILLGKRAWDPDKNPDLLDFMRSVVNSKISHLQEGADNRRGELAPVPGAEARVDHFDTFPHQNAPTADIQLQEKEDEARNSDLILRFYDFVADDKLLQGIVGCMIEGVSKRSEIAAALKTKEQEITNADKRLERRCKEFRKAHADKNPFKSPET